MKIRDNKGRFARVWKWTKRVFVLSLFAAVGVAMFADHWVGQELVAVAPVQIAHAGITMEAKVALTKGDLVESLAKQCETKTATDPDAAIIFDSNNEPSIGAFQYQRKTVIHYYKVLYGKDISRVEAIQIAIDHKRAADLTTDILFKTEEGWRNWFNCAHTLDLPVQIQLLKKLEQ